MIEHILADVCRMHPDIKHVTSSVSPSFPPAVQGRVAAVIAQEEIEVDKTPFAF